MTARAGDTPPSGAPAVIGESLQGKCAGFASRFAAFAADVGVSVGVFMLTLAAISFAARVLTGKDITWNKADIWVGIAYAAWGFVHFAYCWAVSGRTAGMALSGVRVVTDDSADASGHRAGRAHTGGPVELPVPGTGVRRHPAGGPAPGPA